MDLQSETPELDLVSPDQVNALLYHDDRIVAGYQSRKVVVWKFAKMEKKNDASYALTKRAEASFKYPVRAVSVFQDTIYAVTALNGLDSPIISIMPLK